MAVRPRITQAHLFMGLQQLEGAVQRAEGIVPMRKAITTTTIDVLVPEDLELEAHNTLWRSTSPNELTILKLIPTTKATQIAHEYDRIMAFGEDRGFGFFSETTLPKRTQPTFERAVTNIRLLGETSDTFLLASLEKTIKVEGDTSAEAIGRNMVMKNVLRKKAKAVYFADSSTTRLGDGGASFKGLQQQIREGTDGTEGTESPFGSHEIDMEGEPLNVDTFRAKAAKVSAVFGVITCLLMDQFVRADFEASMDGAQRLNFPMGIGALMLGQSIGGLRTQGNDVFFHTDTLLSPIGKGKYKGTAEDGGPSAAPTGTAVAQALTEPESKWRANDGGDYFWIVTEIRDDKESIGRRFPTSGGTTVAAGQEVAFAITPNDPLSDTFRVYRGVAGVDADTDAYYAFSVANDGNGNPVSFFDTNHYRPKTGTVFGLSILSEAGEALNSAPSGVRNAYALAKENSDAFFTQKDRPDNTVSLAQLGPAMGVMELAAILATVSRPLVYSACAPQVRNPHHNIVFINVGSTSFSG